LILDETESICGESSDPACQKSKQVVTLFLSRSPRLSEVFFFEIMIFWFENALFKSSCIWIFSVSFFAQPLQSLLRLHINKLIFQKIPYI